MGGRSGRYAAFLVVMLGLGAAGSRPRAAGEARRAAARPARQPPAGSRCAGRAAADEPLPRAGDAAGGRRPARWTPSRCRVGLQPEGGEAVELLRPGRRFAEGASGWLRPKQDLSGARSLAVYVEPGRRRWQPATRYTVARLGRPRRAGPARPRTPAPGASPPRRPPRSMRLDFPLDLERRAGPLARPVLLGRLQRHLLLAGRELRADVRADGRGPQGAPPRLETTSATSGRRARSTARRASSRSGCPTSSASARRAGSPRSSRAREASCSASRTSSATSSTASPRGRPVGEDYHPGDEVLIADGVHDARTKVLAADGAAGTVTVAPVATPPGGWKIAYDGPLPAEGRPRRAGAVPAGRVLPPQVRARTARRATTGGGSTRSGTWPTAGTAAA